MVFAKSTPIDDPETLFCHTKAVVEAAKLLKDSYGDKILHSVPSRYKPYFWDALFLACKAHDLGKMQSPFQNKILKACKREKQLLPIHKGIKQEGIPHNIISPAFIHNHVKIFPKEIRPALYKAIAFHHRRGKELLEDKEWMAVHELIINDISKRMDEIYDMQSLFDNELVAPSANYLRKLQTRFTEDEDIFYLLLKGLLHRADHSGSAHLPNELHPYKYSSQQVVDYLLIRKGVHRNNVWQLDYASSALDDNVVLQAGTGSGKTEFALYWIGKEKAFYTLPMRTSVNAMYQRLKETYNSEDIGLLHSDSSFYVLSDHDKRGNNTDDGIADALDRIDMSKQLSMPISVSTADQIFTAAFKYDGYEKIFATLSYSKLVIDEIQSYDPDIVAVILNMLVNVSKLGCKFCIITATLPRLYLDYLKERIQGIKDLPPRFRISPRHKIRLLSKPMDDPETIDLIACLNQKYGGVLVIANTIKMAKKVKTLLSERGTTPSLLHSMFTYEDRMFKEQDEKQGILKNQSTIWITTQIAEVSLNIDFNVMVTEISTIDSQVQRWGRVWRNRNEEYVDSAPNIFITPIPSDNGHIYDKDLIKLTEASLYKRGSTLLSDKNEFELVQNVFDDPALEESKYKSKFDTSSRMLEENNFSIETKREAQQLFRHISNIMVIPSDVYFNSQHVIDEAINNLEIRDRIKKLKSLQTIRKKSVSVPYYYLKEIRYWFLNSKYEVIVADMKYSFDNGVELAPVTSASFI